MDGLKAFLIVVLDAVFCIHWISGLELDVFVRPGDNATLVCDCRETNGKYIVWFKNCSHENQPTLVLETRYRYRPLYLVNAEAILNPFPRLHLVKNQSSSSYDLQIVNITKSNEGLYYCGTEEKKQDNRFISEEYVYTYGNIRTRLLLNSTEPHQHGDVCWTLLFALCPTVAALSFLFSFPLVYCLCVKKAKEPQNDKKRSGSRSQIRQQKQDVSEVCYAVVEICQAPKKKTTQRSDFSTYSAIRTSTV